MGDEEKLVLFFDIDNTLYSKNSGVEPLMKEAIQKYISTTLSLDDESADMLHKNYYKEFGLAIEGLVRFNHIDAMDYNRKVDDSLPLDDILKPDPELRRMLEAIDRSKVTVWLFTNAYITHGKRVVRLLGLEDLFDGITYCDYSKIPLICKPKPAMFDKVMKEAGVTSPEHCYYVDDSELNCKAAMRRNWKHVLHFTEGEPSTQGHSQIASLCDLPKFVPELFVPEKIESQD